MSRKNGRSLVAVVKTDVDRVLEDYPRLMRLAGYTETLDPGADTLIKLNLSWTKYFPACSTQPWQLEGVLGALFQDGFITEPGESNAVARLLQVLALDPGNSDASALLKSAAGRLADVASEAYDAGLVDDAKHYLELALAVTPDVAAWRELRARWELESSTAASGA